MNQKRILIALAWPYVNGNLHIGHVAGYLLPADIFARFHRLIGNKVLMVSGSDCYGTPITVQADKEKITPQEIVDKYHKKIVDLFFNKLLLTYDIYTTTTTEIHKKITQDILLALWHKNYASIKKQDQYFDPQEKRFLPDRYVEGECPHCHYLESRSDQCDNCGQLLEQNLINPKSKITKNAVELNETEHVFIDWAKLENKIKNYFKKYSNNWRPWVKNETQGWLNKGLESRPVTRDLDWGIEIPTEIAQKLDNAKNKRIYVWFDAVIGYLSASIEWAEKNNQSWQEFWYEEAEHCYFMGKDNLIFHTIFWPGQLMAYDEKINLPTNPLINQFLNISGEKFSKSRNRIIEPGKFIDYFGIDSLRFYLTAIMPESADSNFTWDDFLVKNNDLLVGQIGNYINRVLVIYKDNPQKSSNNIDPTALKVCQASFEKCNNHLIKGEFKGNLEEILNLAKFANQYIDKNKPWVLKKEDVTKFNQLFASLMVYNISLGLLMMPITPVAGKKYFEIIIQKEILNWPKPENFEEFIKDIINQINIQNPEGLYKKFLPEDIERFNSENN